MKKSLLICLIALGSTFFTAIFTADLASDPYNITHSMLASIPKIIQDLEENETIEKESLLKQKHYLLGLLETHWEDGCKVAERCPIKKNTRPRIAFSLTEQLRFQILDLEQKAQDTKLNPSVRAGMLKRIQELKGTKPCD